MSYTDPKIEFALHQSVFDSKESKLCGITRYWIQIYWSHKKMLNEKFPFVDTNI